MNFLTVTLITLSCYVNIFGCDLLRVNPAEEEEGEATIRIKRLTLNQMSNNDTNRKWNLTWTDKLKKDLLLNYDKFSRPSQIGDKVVVNVDLVIRHIEMDELKSVMSIHSWVRMSWNDEKLKWNPSEYGGLKELHLADHEIWQPDIYPYNGVIGSRSDHFGSTNCIAEENGTVLWVPPSFFQVFCQMDLTYWPFDTQVCSLMLGSWTYSGEQVDLQFFAETEDPEKHLLRNSEWKFLKLEKERHSVYYPCCPSPYIDVTYNITVQRQYPTYVALLLTPASVIIIMSLCVFLIPPTSTDKLTLGGAAIVITCLFLLYFTQKLPIMAGQTPLIVLFYSRTLYFLSFSIIISVVVINIAKNPKFSPLPWKIKNLFTGCLGKCLFLNNLTLQAASKSMPKSDAFKAEETADNLPVLTDQEKHRGESSNYEVVQQDWILLAVAIDRIAFVLYCLIFAILAVTYSV